MKYRICIEQDEDDVFVAECPTLPGCVSQGKTRTEVVRNIKEAIEGYLVSLKKHDEPVPHRELAKGTLRAIIKQAGLSREEFFELL